MTRSGDTRTARKTACPYGKEERPRRNSSAEVEPNGVWGDLDVVRIQLRNWRDGVSWGGGGWVFVGVAGLLTYGGKSLVQR